MKRPVEIPHRRGFLFLLLTIWSLVLAAGCGTELPITAPQYRERLADLGPVAVMEPLVTVYREMPYETVLDDKKAQAATRNVLATAGRLLHERGWPVIPVDGLEWAGLQAGYPLARQHPTAPDPRSRAAAAVLRQLDRVGERVRVHHRPEGIPHVEAAVLVGDLQTLAPEAKSFLFMTVTGCFGRVTEGPCLNLQYPLLQNDYDDPAYKHVLTVPLGMAIQLYWLEAESGRLLWYDDFSRFNLDPGSGEDPAVLVEKGLAAFPHRP